MVNEIDIPIGIIEPNGGEPLYIEAGSGLYLTARDFSEQHGFKSKKDFLVFMKKHPTQNEADQDQKPEMPATEHEKGKKPRSMKRTLPVIKDD